MAVDYSKYHSILDSYEPYQPPADQSAPTQNTSALGDFGTDLKRGLQQVPSAITGLLDIPVAAVTGRPMVSEGWEGLGQITGFQPQKWADEARAEYSPERQAAQQQAAQAEGFVDTAGVYLSNPSMIAGTVLESIPSIALGGVYGRALRGVGALSGVTRGAIGEGAVMAGQSMNEMVEDGVDPRRAAAFATGVGAAGGALGVLGGSLTQRMGLIDPDTLAAGGVRAALPEGRQPMGLLRRVTGGAVAEGVFEEMPQTMVETVAGNLAAERPWDEDLGKNAAVGLLAGGLMGGVVNIPGARRQRDLTQDAPPQGEQDLFGDAAQQAQATESAQPRTADAIRTEYSELAAQVSGLRDRMQAEGVDKDTVEAQSKALTDRMRALRAEMREIGLPDAALSQSSIEKRLSALDKEIPKLEAQFNTALQDNPGKATSLSVKLAERVQERELLRGQLPQERDGQLGLFDAPQQAQASAPAAQAPQQVDEDPAVTSLRGSQYAGAIFKKDGAMRQNADAAWKRYNEFADSEIDAAIEELAPQPKAAWRIAMLESIRAARAQETQPQGAPDVQPAQVDAASGQGTGAVPAGSTGNTPDRPVDLGRVDRPAGAPAPGSAAGVPVGEPNVQQPASVESVLDAVSPVAQPVVPQGAQPANVPPTEQVAPQATEARGQEGAQVEQAREPVVTAEELRVAQKRDVDPTAPGAVRVISSDGVERWVTPSKTKTAAKGKRAAGERVPFEQLRGTEQQMVRDFMGYDEFGEVSEEVEPMSLRQMASVYGVSHETLGKRLAALGYTNEAREQESAAEETFLTETVIGREDASPELSDEAIDIADVVGGNLRVQKGVGAKGDTGAGRGYQKLLTAGTRFDARRDGRPIWSEAAIAEAVASNALSDEQLVAAEKELAARAKREADERAAKQSKRGERAAPAPRTQEQIAKEGRAVSRAQNQAERDARVRAEREAAEREAQRRVAAEAALQREYAALLAMPEARKAASYWNRFADEGAPSFDELPQELQVEWVERYTDLLAELPADARVPDAMEALQSATQQEFLNDEAYQRAVGAVGEAVAGGDSAGAQNQSVEEGNRPDEVARADAREEVTSTNPLEARVAALRELDLGEKQSARLDKLIRRHRNGEIDTERLGEELQAMEEQAFPEDRGGKGMRFSRTSNTIDSATAGLGDGTGTQAQYLTEDRSEFRGTVDGLHGASTPLLNVTDPSEVPPRLRNDAGAWSDGESDGFYFAEPEDRSWFRGSKIRMPDFRYAYEVNVRFNRAFLLTPQTLERFVEQFGTDPMRAVRAMREQGFDGVVTRGFDTDWQVMDALVEQYGLEGGAMSWGPMLMDQAVSFDPAKNVRITGRDGKLTEAIRRVTTAESRLRLLAKRAGIDLDAARVANARYNESVGTPNEEYYAGQPGAAEAVRFFARDDVSAAVAEVERANNAVLELAEQPRGEPRFSRTADTRGTTVEAVRSAINAIATPMGRRKITIVQSADELVERGVLNSSQARGTQGYVTRKGDAFFIADNIRPGNELAVVLHEIGAHLGIEKLLTDKQYESLVKKIFDWAQSDAATQEARIARAAIRRVAQANIENEADLSPETIAYFIEEAVKAGVNPTAMQYKSELGRWFRTLWAAFKVALRRLNLINADRLTAQNVVDLAYGAARIELASTYHGTAANFRRFDHRFMGSGEGAQAFGWGTYLAQRFGIANEYFEADVRRKGEDSSVRALQIDGVPVADYRATFDSGVDNDAEKTALTTLDVVSAFRIGWKTKDEIVQDAVEQLRHGMPWQTDYAAADWLENNADRISIKEASKPEGNIHIVDVNFTEDEMLDWFEPISKQSPQVRETLETLSLPDSARFTKARDVAKIEFTETTNRYDETVLDGVLGGDALTLTVSKTFGGGERVRVRVSNLRTRQTEFSGTFDSREAAYDAVAGFKSNLQWRNMLAADPKGSSAYKFLEDALGSDKAASEYLDSLGIKGIKFLDAKSRGNDQYTIDESAGRYYVLKLLPNGRTDVMIGDMNGYATRAEAEAVGNKWRGDKTRNLVVFNDRNIYRVGSMRGGPVDKGGRMMFSKAADPQLVEIAQESGQRALKAIQAGIRKGWTGLAFSSHLANAAHRAGLTSARALELVQRKKATRAYEIQIEVEKVLSKFASLKGKIGNEDAGTVVQRFIYDSTFDKKWGFKPEWKNDAVVDPEMERRFNALPSEAQGVIRDVFRHGDAIFREKQDLLRKTITGEYEALIKAETDDGKRRKLERQRDKELREAGRLIAELNGPYAPLRRYGNYVVVAKSQKYRDAEAAGPVDAKLKRDENHYVVEFAETLFEAEKLQSELESKFGKGAVWAGEKEASTQQFGELPFMAVQRLRKMVDTDLEGDLNTKSKRTLNKLLVDLYISTLHEANARHSEQKRQYVNRDRARAAGDMMRAFATQGRADSHLVSALQFNSEIVDEMQKLRNEAKNDQGDSKLKTRLRNEILQRHMMDLDFRETPVQDKLMSLNSFWMLLTSPGYYVQNATQVMMMTQPVLAGKFGQNRSMRHLMRGYQDAMRVLKGSSWNEAADLSRFNGTADEKAMLVELQARGTLDFGISAELGYWESRGEISKVFNQVMRKVGMGTRKLEVLNRMSSALAAYRMMYERSTGTQNERHAAALEYADTIIKDTHGDYSTANAPRYLRMLPKVMTQFRKFQLIQLSLFAKVLHGSVSKAQTRDAIEERRAMRAALGYLFMNHALLAGAVGVPASALLGAVYAIAGDDDDPNDWEVDVRRAIGDKEMADLILHGLPSLVNINMSNKIGAGTMLDPLPFVEYEATRGGYEKAVTAAMGPLIGGLGAQAVDAVGRIMQGDVAQGTAQLLPRGFRDAARGFMAAQDGVQLRNGQTALTPEELSFYDSLMMGLGLPTLKTTSRTETQFKTQQYETFFRERVTKLKRQYSEAYEKNDRQAMLEARQAWAEMQASRKNLGFKVQPLSELLKAPREKAKAEAKLQGGVRTTEQARGFVQSLQ